MTKAAPVSGRYVQFLLCCSMSHTLVLCQFKLSLKFIIAYCALEFLPAENVKFHNFTLISIHINIDSNQDKHVILILPNFSDRISYRHPLPP